jgi:hypothetical protein
VSCFRNADERESDEMLPHSGWETKKLRKQFIGNRQVMEKRWLSFFVMIIYALGYRNPPDHSKISA